MKTELEGNEFVSRVDIRELLKDKQSRALVVSQVAPHIEYVLIRTEQGLGLLTRDVITGAVLGVVGLRDILAKSLDTGTLTDNTLDHLPRAEALAVVTASLAELVDDVQAVVDVCDTPEEQFSSDPLTQRPAEVEAELIEKLELAG